MKSRWALIIMSITMFIAGYFYYPKWKFSHSEALISWDVSGYYHYLPAIFIYKDLKSQKWLDSINTKYLPSPVFDQSFVHAKSGNKVNKYFIGQAILFTPGFLLAHSFAVLFNSHPADGYSKPYQISIWLSGLLFSIAGLCILRSVLLHYFEDDVVGYALVLICFATNYFEYAAIANGMNHAWLFTLLSLLIALSIRFYKKFDYISAAGIGITLGISVLVRPTEIIWVLIPLLWGSINLKERVSVLRKHYVKILIAGILCLVIVSIQLIYWKIVTDEWLVYAYRDQGFNFLKPNIVSGLFGAKIGWWLYTPLMLIAMLGWYELYKLNRGIFWPSIVTSFLAVYITLSWGHFESGGGLGQRNLIQIYPLLSFPLAALMVKIYQRGKLKYIWFIVSLGLIYTNLWWIHQAHRGGFFHAGQMTKEYFLNVVGRINPNKDYVKLLDTKEYFHGTPRYEGMTLFENFNNDTSILTIDLSNAEKAIRLNAENQFFTLDSLPLTNECNSWLRFKADFQVLTREWDLWKYTQWIVQFYNKDKIIKTNSIRIQRLVRNDHQPTQVTFDVKFPKEDFTKCSVSLWNADSKNTILMDNLEVSCFSE